MRLSKKWAWSFLLMVLPTLVVAATDGSAMVNYSGTLVALPCTIEPGTEDIYIDMGEVPNKSLNSYTRLPGKLVEFELKDCDVSLGNMITVLPTGKTNALGLLKFDQGSTASGAVIRLETLNGIPLIINVPHSISIIENGDMTIRLMAVLQHDPLDSNDIVVGEYTATLNFAFNYE
ncbi:fimbrial protein [Providencia alcalifaciens]|uniref:fimbrial protein n=1 Tax=Providencia alcalifaciens TaxID=126385 RepID=UPI003D953970